MAISLLLGVVALVVSFALPGRSLLDQATRITLIQRQQVPGLPPSYTHYRWIANNKLLLFTLMPGSRGPEWKISLLNVDTGVEIPMTALMDTLDTTRPISSYLATVSPDGKQWLWPTDATTYVTDPIAMHTQRWQIPSVGMPFTFWLNDSRHFARLQYGGISNNSPVAVCLYDIRDPKSVQSVPINSPPEFNLGLVAGQPEFSLPMITPDGQIEALAEDADGASYTMVRMPLGPHVTARKITIDAPAGREFAVPSQFGIHYYGQGEGLAISPQGDRIVWMCRMDPNTIGLRAILQRFFPNFFRTRRQEMSLWISDAEGQHMREVGSLMMPAESAMFHADHTLRWTSDGKRISFVYKEYLYTVPVEGG